MQFFSFCMLGVSAAASLTLPGLASAGSKPRCQHLRALLSSCAVRRGFSLTLEEMIKVSLPVG